MSRRLALVCLVWIWLLAPQVSRAQSSRDGYVGVVTKSDKRKVGEQFTFANVRSPRPFVTYPSGSGAELIKAFEDDELIVLVFVANVTGSTETFYLSKRRNRFTIVEVGVMEATVTGSDFRPDITHGTLR